MESLSNSIKVISENLNKIKSEINLACSKADRDPGSVKIVVVTKRVNHSIIELLGDLGVKDIGENKVQDAESKSKAVSKEFTWHMIGHLQTNKARKAIEVFNTIHSIDSQKIAEKLNQELEKCGKSMNGFVQVDFSDNPERSGVDPKETAALVNIIKNSYKRINLRGLMTLPPMYEDSNKVRLIFKELARLGDQCSLSELSMGMSNDFVEAVEEGATIIRIGSRVFQGISN